MKVLTIAATGLRRFLREKENVFFVFIFPILIIMFIGLQFGAGSAPTLGVVGSGTPVGQVVVDAVSSDGFGIREYGSADELLDAVELRQVEAGIVIEDTDPVASDRPTQVTFISREGFGLELRSAVQAAAVDMSAELRAARYVADVGGMGAAEASALIGLVTDHVEVVDVAVSRGGEPLFEGEIEQFDFGASSQVVLFTFLTSLSTSGHLILTRKLGVSSRMLVSPTPVGVIVSGETLGRYAVALVQALFIILATAFMFGVDWGDPLGSAAVIGVFALVSTAAGILLGSLLQNDQQAGGVGVMLGIGLGALGGSMLPYELFPDTVQRIARFTPHYWALRGFRDLLFTDGTIADVTDEIGVLAAIAVGLLAVATWAYRRAITH